MLGGDANEPAPDDSRLPPDAHGAWRIEDFADAVERFKDFIIANSLTPVTRASLDAFVEKRRTELLSNASKTPAGAPRCSKTELFVDYQADGRETRRADVAKILAVPRPPVMNPCFQAAPCRNHPPCGALPP